MTELYGGKRKKVDLALQNGIRQLEAALHETDQAADRILGLCELLHAQATDTKTRLKVEGIMEACAFQDITGQRMQKVLKLLKYLRTGQGTPETHLGPKATSRDGLSQADIDRLLKGERVS